MCLQNYTHKIVHSSAMYYQNLIIIHECSKKLLKVKNSKSFFYLVYTVPSKSLSCCCCCCCWLNAFLAQAYGGLSRWQLRMKALHVCLSSAMSLTLARDVTPLVLQLFLRQSVHRLGWHPLGRVPWITPSSAIFGNRVLSIRVTWP